MKQKLNYLILPAILVAVIAYCLNNGPHDFTETECFLCHQGDITHGELKGSGITFLCTQCHKDLFSEGYMHPYDVLPQKVHDIPPDFPLDINGRITCNTCHDVHADFETPFGTPSNYLRRFETGKEFCDLCHAAAGEAKGHAAFLGEAHLSSKYIAVVPEQEIDSLSKNCISCHDGSFATSVSISSGYWTHQASSFSKSMNNHPIGIDYEQARLEHSKKTDLRPIAMVDRRLLFFDGKIGCGTCHNPYASELLYLVKSDFRSQLCFSCHMIDR